MGERRKVDRQDHDPDGKATLTTAPKPVEFLCSEADFRAWDDIPDDIEFEIDTDVIKQLLKEELEKAHRVGPLGSSSLQDNERAVV